MYYVVRPKLDDYFGDRKQREALVQEMLPVIGQLENKGVEIFVYVAVLLFILLLFLYTKLIQSKKVFLDNLYLLLLVFIVPLWYLVLRNHSIQHGWFTWRASIVSVFALLIFILNTTKLTLNKKQNG